MIKKLKKKSKIMKEIKNKWFAHMVFTFKTHINDMIYKIKKEYFIATG